MQRLLKDAEKLSGVKYDMNNLGDVYSAIHVIQEDLGLTGVAAKEASETFTGSLGAMKASAENLLANLALGNDIKGDIQNLMGTVQTFVIQNLAPMVKNILSALPQLLNGLGRMIMSSLSLISDNAGEITSLAVTIVTSLVNEIIKIAPLLGEAAVNLALALGKSLWETDWISIGTNILTKLRESISTMAGGILGSDTSIITGVLDSITASLPGLLQSGIEIITSIANSILEQIPQMITVATDLTTQFASFILSNLPILMQSGYDLLVSLVSGIEENLPAIGQAALDAIVKFIAVIGQNLPQILQTGIEILMKLITGLLNAIPKLIAAIPKITNAIKEAFGKYDWKAIGRDILEGIKRGILNTIDAVVEAAKEAGQAIWDAIKSFFSIGSPSKLMAYAGEMIDAGLAEGVLNNQGMVDSAIKTLGNGVMSEFNPQFGGFVNNTDSRIDTLIDLLNNYLPTIASGENQKVVIEADAGRMFRVMQRESIRNTQLVGVNSVLSATT